MGSAQQGYRDATSVLAEALDTARNAGKSEGLEGAKIVMKAYFEYLQEEHLCHATGIPESVCPCARHAPNKEANHREKYQVAERV